MNPDSGPYPYFKIARIETEPIDGARGPESILFVFFGATEKSGCSRGSLLAKELPPRDFNYFSNGRAFDLFPNSRSLISDMGKCAAPRIRILH
jgi:hypothetical protein